MASEEDWVGRMWTRDDSVVKGGWGLKWKGNSCLIH